MEWNHNVLDEIFSRLSLKCLARFKCVSKDWESLIPCPFFLKLNGFIVQPKQLSNSNENNSSFIQLDNSRGNESTILFNLLPKDILIMETCNGLILCRSNSPKSIPYVLNPVKRKAMKFTFSSSSALEITTAIASDSYQRCCTTDDFPNFKLVRVISGYRSQIIKFEVYSSEIRACRVSNATYDSSSKRISITRRGVYIKGVLYWIMNRQKLLSFHVEEELTSVISLPCNYPFASYHHVLGESEGILHYVEISRPLYLRPLRLRMWFLDNDETWKVKHCQNIENILEEYEPHSNGWIVRKRVAILCFKDSILLLKIHGRVILYDIKNNKVTCIYSDEDLNIQKPPFFPLLSVTKVFSFP
ncbi:hypothetical protein PIB30_054867 [Stylosanthes scabra]|uniref:F-box domain-containing protein n=1 Tax=Stylosanthes scabra TaxID=79078 RepID=A0ABU6WIT3_9FABA|nr:hypothetical protein [Stylosanthes scabra]